MTDSLLQIQSDFDRLAALDDGRWDHNRHYHPFLLRHLPSRRDLALEIGCGTGDFARSLARHFERVVAIDLSPEMVRRARELSPTSENIEFRQGDVRACGLPTATFDCIATIATLHHLPLVDTLKKLDAALCPGGVLLVLDLYEPRTLADWTWMGGGYVANLLVGAWKLRRLRQASHVRQAWAEHARHDVYPTLAEIRSTGARLLPGAAVRRHLFWRCSLIWRKPAASKPIVE